jgi:methylated-DNA-[protein]-cysteine S-methyltransferase
MRNAECGTRKTVFLTSFGWSGVAVSDNGICGIVLPKKSRKAAERELKSGEFPGLRPPRAGSVRSGEKLSGQANQLNKSVLLLEKYFSGERVVFDLPLDFRYYTPFQQSVWRACAAIPFGKTRSYLWIARRIKKPKAARAVGQAMGANPFPVIVP